MSGVPRSCGDAIIEASTQSQSRARIASCCTPCRRRRRRGARAGSAGRRGAAGAGASSRPHRARAGWREGARGVAVPSPTIMRLHPGAHSRWPCASVRATWTPPRRGRRRPLRTRRPRTLVALAVAAHAPARRRARAGRAAVAHAALVRTRRVTSHSGGLASTLGVRRAGVAAAASHSSSSRTTPRRSPCSAWSADFGSAPHGTPPKTKTMPPVPPAGSLARGSTWRQWGRASGRHCEFLAAPSSRLPSLPAGPQHRDEHRALVDLHHRRDHRRRRAPPMAPAAQSRRSPLAFRGGCGAAHTPMRSCAFIFISEDISFCGVS